MSQLGKSNYIKANTSGKKSTSMEKRAINGNEPAAPLIKVASYETTDYLGLPIKLLLAKDFMAAHVTGSVYAGFPYKSEEVAAQALKDAEALLNAYNNS